MTDKKKPFILALSVYAAEGIYDMTDPRCSRCFYHTLHESRPGQPGACNGNTNEQPCGIYHPPLNTADQAKSRAAFSEFIQVIDDEEDDDDNEEVFH